MKNKHLLLFLWAFLLGNFTSLQAQFEESVTLPNASQKSQIMQTIGLSKITVEYHSPAVKGREVWGKLVPYDKVWRAGANENTTITFTDDVKINGKYLPAGTFGVHIIPSAEEWTVIFSQNSTSWGSYFYDKGEDILRIKVKPETAEHREWLAYDFINREAQSATLVMHWEKVKIPLKFEVDVHKVVLENLRQEMRSLPYWSWVGSCQAAGYCVQYNINHEEALEWVNRSIAVEKTFTNLMTKSRLLAQMDKAEEAKKTEEEAYKIAKDGEMGNYTYQLGVIENQGEKALSVAEKRAELFPKSWSALAGLGQAYQKAGKIMQALKYFKMALPLVQGNDGAKQWIQGQIKALSSSKK